MAPKCNTINWMVESGQWKDGPNVRQSGYVWEGVQDQHYTFSEIIPAVGTPTGSQFSNTKRGGGNEPFDGSTDQPLRYTLGSLVDES